MIELRAVTKTFVGPDGRVVEALRSVDLRVDDGTTHCLIGTSGCGKTTTLRLVNRLEEPSAGEVLVGGQDVRARDVITLRRSIGYVVQGAGLFPHMTVGQNVAVLAELEGWAHERVQARVDELLELVGLPPATYAARRPAELSGGQQQRVGIARALVLDPDMLLMDEPFGALDPITRTQLHDELRSVFASLQKTVLLVTHDLDEAFLLGDRITLMDAGEVRQSGTREDLLERPSDEFVRRFVESQAGRGT